MSPLPLGPLSRPRPTAVAPASAGTDAEVAIPVRLPGDLRRRIGAVAKRTGLTAAELIATGVAEYLCALEARLAAGGAATRAHAASPGSRVRAQVQAHADRQAQTQARAEAPTGERDPLDRFFDRLSPQEAFERTYSGSTGKSATGTP